MVKIDGECVTAGQGDRAAVVVPADQISACRRGVVKNHITECRDGTAGGQRQIGAGQLVGAAGLRAGTGRDIAR